MSVTPQLSISDLEEMIENSKLKYEVNEYTTLTHARTQKIYQITGFCIRENDLEVCILYRENGSRLVWNRPVKEMFEMVQIEKPRFIKE